MTFNEVIRHVDIEEIIRDCEKKQLVRLKKENTQFKKIRRYVAGAAIGVLLLGGAYLAWRNYNPPQKETDRTEYSAGIQQEQGETAQTIETAVEKKPEENTVASPPVEDAVHAKPKTYPAKTNPLLINTGQEILEGQGVKVTYFFTDINTGKTLANVEVLAYPCLDNGCNTLDLSHPLPGAGNSGSSSQKTVLFPEKQMKQHDYAAYFFADGYAAYEANPTWHGAGSTDFEIKLNKIKGCKAKIDDVWESLYLTSDSTGKKISSREGYIGVEINSAFRKFNSKDYHVGYTPSKYVPNFYSSMVEVKFSVYNSSNELVHSEKKAVNIKMDSKEVVYSSLMPFGKGNYNVGVETTVTNSQCIDTMPQIKKISFYVN